MVKLLNFVMSVATVISVLTLIVFIAGYVFIVQMGSTSILGVMKVEACFEIVLV